MPTLLLLPLAFALQHSVSQAMARRQGAVVVMEVVSGKVLAEYHPDIAEHRAVKPGSTIKPFTLLALLKTGAAGEMPCGRTLVIGSRNLSCSHPPVPGRLSASEALAYSCNFWFAGMAKRLPPGALTETLRTAGFTVSEAATTPDGLQLQALGEADLLSTPMALAGAYRKLALSTPPPVLQGLMDATNYGTARLAKPDGLEVAGKTGTATSEDRIYKHGWFAGWAPARNPRIVVVVFIEQGQGGGDAAPVARKVFEAWQHER